jgi:hypothetical protein
MKRKLLRAAFRIHPPVNWQAFVQDDFTRSRLKAVGESRAAAVAGAACACASAVSTS